MKDIIRSSEERPRVSVVMPSYNHEKYIEECINSILNQTFTDFELIITDDGSSDRTVEKIKHFNDPRIKLFVHKKNQGTSVTSNNCIKRAAGEFIAHMNSDDVWELDKLEKQVKFLDKNANIAAAFTKVRLISENSSFDYSNPYVKVFEEKNMTREEWLRRFFLFGNCLCHPSALIRKNVFEKVGLYNERMGGVHDYDLWVRICLEYNIQVIDEPLVRFRMRDNHANAGSMTLTNINRHKFERRKILDNYLKINNKDFFLRVFPDATKYGFVISNNIPYFLAKLAIDTSSDFYRLWALDTLYDFLGGKSSDELLKILPEFSFVSFINMTGTISLNTQSIKRQLSGYFWRTTNFLSNLNKKLRQIARATF
jgi:glycosyltransferase involved in cell wall biosynthesis